MEYLLEQRKPNDFTISANNPSKRPLSSESEDDRHDRSEEEGNEGGMTSALASALEEAEADARARPVVQVAAVLSHALEIWKGCAEPGGQSCASVLPRRSLVAGLGQEILSQGSAP